MNECRLQVLHLLITIQWESGAYCLSLHEIIFFCIDYRQNIQTYLVGNKKKNASIDHRSLIFYSKNI